MFLFFTPYTYLFLSLYFIIIVSIFSISNFFIFWLFIEVLILLFIGVSYTLFTHSYTQLIIYFLFQTLGSFSILVIYLFSLKYLLYFSLFFKLGIFPFFSWYINVLYRFPSFMLFLASTFHKLPPIYIFYLIVEYSDIRFLILISVITVLVSSIFILYIYDLRYLLIVSSIGNNSFMLLAVLTNRIIVFTLFYITYTLTIFLLLTRFNNLTSHSYSYRIKYSIFGTYLLMLLLNLASFPPFPGFILKFLVFFRCISQYPVISPILLLLIVVNVIIIISYINVFFKYIVNIYRNSSNLILY